MNTIQRYMVLNSLVLVVIPVMSQQKEDKEIKLNEEAVKLIQFDFLPGDMWNSYKRSFVIEYQLYRKITVQKSY